MVIASKKILKFSRLFIFRRFYITAVVSTQRKQRNRERGRKSILLAK